jgi:hypothetical protein
VAITACGPATCAGRTRLPGRHLRNHPALEISTSAMWIRPARRASLPGQRLDHPGSQATTTEPHARVRRVCREAKPAHQLQRTPHEDQQLRARSTRRAARGIG